MIPNMNWVLVFTSVVPSMEYLLDDPLYFYTEEGARRHAKLFTEDDPNIGYKIYDKTKSPWEGSSYVA